MEHLFLEDSKNDFLIDSIDNNKVNGLKYISFIFISALWVSKMMMKKKSKNFYGHQIN